MTRPLLSPAGKRKAEREERDRQALERAAKKVEDERKAKEEQGKQDAERAKKEKQVKERKKQEEREKQKKDKEEKERELAKTLETVYTKMTDTEAAHRAACKKAKEDAAAAEKTRLQTLQRTNPCLFDKELKYVITTLLHTNIYERDNPYRNLFESQGIMSWVKFLQMYKTNPLSVYTDQFPWIDRDGNKVTGPDQLPRTVKLNDGRASPLLMLFFYATEWLMGTPPRHSFTVNLEDLAKNPSKWDKGDVYQYNQIHFWSDLDTWKAKNKIVPTTVNTSTSTPVSSLPSPPSMNEYERNLDQWNKGRRDYQKYPILKDDAEFPNWKDRFVTYAKTEHMARMVDKDKAFNKLSDPHDIELWESQEQHMKLALHYALQTDVSKAI